MMLRDVKGPLSVERLTPNPHTSTAADTVLGRRRFGYGVVVDWSLLCGKRPHAWPEEGCLVTEPGGLVRWQPAKEARSLLSAHPAYRWGYMQRRLSVTKNEKQSE